MAMFQPVGTEKGHQRFKAKSWICHMLLTVISHWPNCSYLTLCSCKGGWLRYSLALRAHPQLNNFWHSIPKRMEEEQLPCGFRVPLEEFVVSTTSWRINMVWVSSPPSIDLVLGFIHLFVYNFNSLTNFAMCIICCFYGWAFCISNSLKSNKKLKLNVILLVYDY